MLNKGKHRAHLGNILVRLYKDSRLAPALGFKGGTASYLFYGLPRLSVDLDFDLIGGAEEEKVVTRVRKALSVGYSIRDEQVKRWTLFWLVDYGRDERNIKIEISRRGESGSFELKPYYGVKVQTMRVEDIIANKLVALVDRKVLVNRDVYDVWYFLNSKYVERVNFQLITTRTGQKPVEFLTRVLERLEGLLGGNMLSGLGELVSQEQKNWVRKNLLSETKQVVSRVRDHQKEMARG